MKKHLFRIATFNIKKTLLFSFFTLLFCSLGCETEKERDTLKEAFFCTINGEEHYPQKLIGTNKYGIYYDAKGGLRSPSSLVLSVISDRFRYADVVIYLNSNKQPIGVGEYILKDGYGLGIPDFDYENANYARCYFQDKGLKEIIYKPIYDYRTTDEATGSVNVTKIDTVQKIISGTFYFTAINKLQQKVEVQNGRFNTKYNN